MRQSTQRDVKKDYRGWKCGTASRAPACSNTSNTDGQPLFVLAAPLPTRLPTHGPGKAGGDGPSAQAPAPVWESRWHGMLLPLAWPLPRPTHPAFSLFLPPFLLLYLSPVCVCVTETDRLCLSNKVTLETH